MVNRIGELAHVAADMVGDEAWLSFRWDAQIRLSGAAKAGPELWQEAARDGLLCARRPRRLCPVSVIIVSAMTAVIAIAGHAQVLPVSRIPLTLKYCKYYATEVMKRLTRAEQAERNRGLVLAAARRVFLARGYHGATLEQIADEAGF